MTEENDTPKIPATSYNLPGNSHKAKGAPKKEVKRVTEGKVVERKKSLGKRMAETFTGDDASSVGGYILFEVALPAVKQLIADAVSQGIERLLFGDMARGGGSRPRPGYTSYNNISKKSRDEPRAMSNRARATHNFSEIVLEDRGEAEEAIFQLVELIENYDVATVSDLYSMIGITGSFVDEKWGWTKDNIGGARVRRVSKGFLLDLPRPIDIND